MSLLHDKVSAAAASSDPAKVGGPDWNKDHVFDAGGINGVTSASDPTTPAAGKIAIYGKALAGGALPAFAGPTNAPSPLQPFLGGSRVGMWSSVGNQNLSPTNFGLAAPAAVGTISTRSVATTNLYTSTRRSGALSAATAGSSSGFRLDRLQFWRGNAAGLGGFRLVARFGVGDPAAVADARSFVGMVATTAALGNADPSTNLNIIGVGNDSGEANLSIMVNDGTGTATKIPLGANFPANTQVTDLYEFTLFAAPNDTKVGYLLRRLNTGDTVSGSIESDLPANMQLLAFQHWRNNGTTALAVMADLVSLYVETDY
jgi:hypothetical protein